MKPGKWNKRLSSSWNKVLRKRRPTSETLFTSSTCAKMMIRLCWKFTTGTETLLNLRDSSNALSQRLCFLLGHMNMSILSTKGTQTAHNSSFIWSRKRASTTELKTSSTNWLHSPTPLEKPGLILGRFMLPSILLLSRRQIFRRKKIVKRLLGQIFGEKFRF